MPDSSVESRRPRPRIESLTDLIFGLALSIGALGLLNNRPSTAGDLVVDIGVFAFSFLILISIWLRYTEVMSVLPFETRRTRGLNIVLLFFVALEPYLYNLLLPTSGLIGEVSTTAYAIDIGSIYAILASFNNILASEGLGLIDRKLLPAYRLTRNIQVVTSALFFISVVPVFYTVTLAIGSFTVQVRYFFWFASFFFIRGTWIWKRAGRTIPKASS